MFTEGQFLRISVPETKLTSSECSYCRCVVAYAAEYRYLQMAEQAHLCPALHAQAPLLQSRLDA
jgi:hypothetical protein